jgi:hypothetical protein
VKNKYLLVIFVVGILYILVGAFFKIFHFEIGPFTGNSFLTFGLVIEIIALVLFVVKLIKNSDNDILNK